MTHRLISRRRILTAAAWVVPLAGCSLLPDPPAPKMYRLTPQSDDPPDGPLLQSQLVIDLPTAPQSLDTDRIALMRGTAEFDYYADSNWTDRLPVLLQDMLVTAFENNGRIPDVVRSPDTLGPGYVLETDIQEFEARYASSAAEPPAVVVGLMLRLVKLPDHRTVARMQVTEQSPAARNNLDSIVVAFDAAAGRAMDRSVPWALHAISQS
jgi:cholesterol transport system auxiliary component